MMRRISMLNITAGVSRAIAAGTTEIEFESYPDPRVLSVLTVGRDHNYLQPGHYVFIDHALEGADRFVFLRIKPLAVNHSSDPNFGERYIGMVLGSRDAVPCAVHQVMGKIAQAQPEVSWREQDASNS